MVYANKLIGSFSPSVNNEEDRARIDSYQWRLVDIEGIPFDFEKAKGKVVLVNFWATWCPPCVAEMPSLQELYDDYGDKVAFLFVTNDAKEKVAPFMEEKGYTLPIFHETSKAPDQLVSRSIPATYLIDKEGNIVIDKVGAANWNSDKVRSTIDALLQK